LDQADLVVTRVEPGGAYDFACEQFIPDVSLREAMAYTAVIRPNRFTEPGR
jgi:hypothetical protein